jgi:hypothetical protein
VHLDTKSIWMDAVPRRYPPPTARDRSVGDDTKMAINGSGWYEKFKVSWKEDLPPEPNGVDELTTLVDSD